MIKKQIKISAPASRVWQIFTNPLFTRKLGGEYVSHWTVGSSFGWKNLEGKRLTYGEILKIDPEKLLKHSLFGEDKKTVISIITYELKEDGGMTHLFASEEFANTLSKQALQEASEGWNAALSALKEIAENAE